MLRDRPPRADNTETLKRGIGEDPRDRQEVAMKVAFRAVAVSVMLSLAWAGPLAPLATAQQPAAPPAETAPPPPAAPQPQVFQEQVKLVPDRRGVDAYDVGAGAMTALGFPLKIAICGLAGVFGLVVFAGSFAARPDAAAGIVDEGCGSNARWIVRGSDIRPRPSASKAFEWETHRFQSDR
jgi:hypothetical protein